MSILVHHILAEVRGAEAAEAVLAVLDDAADAVAAFETAPEEWRLDAYSQTPALTAELAARAALAAAAKARATGPAPSPYALALTTAAHCAGAARSASDRQFAATAPRTGSKRFPRLRAASRRSRKS